MECAIAVVASRVAWLAVVLVTGAAVVPAAGAVPAAGGPQAESASTRLRPVDNRAAELIVAGARRSATFRALAAALERADTIVYVGTTTSLALPGQTGVTGSARGWRFLRIAIRVPEPEDRLLAWLGHEMQHAVEIASDPTVTDAARLRDFYRKEGVAIDDGVMCTMAAQRVTRAVAYELASGGGGR